MRSGGAVVGLAALLLGGLAAAPAATAQPPADAAGEGLSVWTAQVAKEQIPLLLRAGADGTELGRQVPEKGSGPVELYLTAEQAAEPRGKGVRLAEKKISAQARERLKAAGDGVFRPYSGEGGLKQEIVEGMVG
ncbi:putative zinc-binding carboxypeptidase [Streptomyces malaysiensis]|uniref:Putative zinc-binding carboxypeptidase n=1 Tax=Streptomyces malaysiensis TaxID=92644 RepID=A0A7X6AWH0_STRMQ|nr:putative zinc-binding carboxypeptidase [Streptomyces malaysiensis]